MNGILFGVIAALSAALLLGSEVFVLVTLFDWALLEQFGFSGGSLKIGAYTAILPSLLAAYWIARSALAAESQDPEQEQQSPL